MMLSPPPLATWLLSRLLPAEVREPFLGDLEEGFREILETRGPGAARRWYWSEALRGPFAHRRTPVPMPHARSGDGPMTSMLADLRFALRLVGRRPGFTALVVLILGVGIGATTAIFSAVYPILFAPLPYPHAERLVTVQERGKDGSPAGIGFATVQDIGKMSRSFAGLAAITMWTPALTGRATPVQLTGEHVSFTYFSTLGISPALGRDFAPEEDRPGAPRVAILSNALWRGRFGGDSGLIGQTITLGGTAFTVVGVMPAGFENVLAPATQIWTPLRYDVSLPYACRTCHHLRVVGRLKPGITLTAALTELNAISARLAADYPTEYAAPGMLVPILQDQVIGGVRPALLAVLGAVALVLLIACANVTNLLLARAALREGEFSVRAALGASRGRVIRQLLAESLVLTGTGGVLGIGIAVFGVQALVAIAPAELPRVEAIGVNGPVLLFTVAVVTIIGVVFGLVPAWHATRQDLHQGLKQSGRRSIGTHRVMRSSLVVSEVALALVLLVGSGLLVRTMIRLFAVSPGFDAAHLLTMQVQTTGPAFDDDAYTFAYFDRVLAAARTVPGVESAALTSQLPLSGDYDGYGVHIETKPRANPEEDPSEFRYGVSAGFFEAMRIPLRRGRFLAAGDRADQPPVAVINESFARKFWPNEDPIGQRVRIGAADHGPWRTIVGIVGDVKQLSLSAQQADGIYLPEVQWPYADGAMSLVLRTRGDPAVLAPAVRAAVWSVDKDQPILRVATMEGLAAQSEAQRRFTLLLFTAFAAVALLLAAAGVYGVLSGTVTDRLAEIGVRSALGASRRDILAMIVGQGLGLSGLGIALGLVGAFVLSRLMGALLFDVPPTDFLTYAVVTTLLLMVALGASWVPAWRAARVNPTTVLRAE